MAEPIPPKGSGDSGGGDPMWGGLDGLEILVELKDGVTQNARRIRTALDGLFSDVRSFTERVRHSGLVQHIKNIGSGLGRIAKNMLLFPFRVFTSGFGLIAGAVTGLAVALGGVISLREMWRVGRDIEAQLMRIANITGSPSFALQFRNWTLEMSRQLPVLATDLNQVGVAMSRMGVDPRQFNMKGLVAGSLGEAKSFGETFQTVMEVAKGAMDPEALLQQFTALPYTLASSLRATLPGIQGFADRFKIITNAMGETYGDTIARMQNSTEGLIMRLKGVWADFAEAVASGPFKSMKDLLKDTVMFLEKNRSTIVQVGHDLGTVIQDAIRIVGSAVEGFLTALSGSMGTTHRTFAEFERQVLRPLVLRFDAWSLQFSETLRNMGPTLDSLKPKFHELIDDIADYTIQKVPFFGAIYKATQEAGEFWGDFSNQAPVGANYWGIRSGANAGMNAQEAEDASVGPHHRAMARLLGSQHHEVAKRDAAVLQQFSANPMASVGMYFHNTAPIFVTTDSTKGAEGLADSLRAAAQRSLITSGGSPFSIGEGITPLGLDPIVLRPK